MATYFDFDVTEPLPQFSGVMNDGVLNVTEPMPTFSGTLQTYSLSLDVTEPSPVFEGAMQSKHMELAAIEPLPVFAGELLIGIALNLEVSEPFPTFSGEFQQTYSLDVTEPFPTFEGILSRPLDDLSMAAVEPMPSFAAIMQIGDLTPQQYTVLVMNLKNKVVSTYENYNFNSACRLNGVYLGADAATGIHILSGADDAGDPIDASITLGDSDFGVPNVKYVPELFLTLSGGEMEVYVSRDQDAEMDAVDNDMRGPYPVPAPAEGKTQTKRAKLPGGFRGGHWQFKLCNVNGGEINLQSIEIPVEKSQRRLN